jgi:hypothetical protein
MKERKKLDYYNNKKGENEPSGSIKEVFNEVNEKPCKERVGYKQQLDSLG